LGARALKDLLTKHERIGADTMVFIYHLEDHSVYAPLTTPIFEAWEAGKNIGVTSVITLMEILVLPKRLGKAKLARDYRELLLTYPNLLIVGIDAKTVDIASDLRAKYGIRTPDALQLAAAVQAGASGFITNDARFKQVDEGIEIILLDDFID